MNGGAFGAILKQIGLYRSCIFRSLLVILRCVSRARQCTEFLRKGGFVSRETNISIGLLEISKGLEKN